MAYAALMFVFLVFAPIYNRMSHVLSSLHCFLLQDGHLLEHSLHYQLIDYYFVVPYDAFLVAFAVVYVAVASAADVAVPVDVAADVVASADVVVGVVAAVVVVAGAVVASVAGADGLETVVAGGLGAVTSGHDVVIASEHAAGTDEEI